jgi:hypothetical protein
VPEQWLDAVEAGEEGLAFPGGEGPMAGGELHREAEEPRVPRGYRGGDRQVKGVAQEQAGEFRVVGGAAGLRIGAGSYP